MSNKKKIIYLDAVYPLPINNGGKKGSWAFIKEISKTPDFDFTLIVGKSKNDEDLLQNTGINYKVFEHDYSDFKQSVSQKISMFLNFILKKDDALLPLRFENTKCAKYLESQTPDIVILDSIRSYNMLPANFKKILMTNKKDKKTKFIYISQNAEFQYIKDLGKLEGIFSFKKYLYLFDVYKTKHLEKKIMQNTDGVIFVSKTDEALFKNKLKITPKKSIYAPPLLDKKEKLWNYSPNKTLLFVGAYDFLPNIDAIKWICKELSPKLLESDNEIKIFIAGTSKKNIDFKIPSNVEFLGFVTDKKLELLHLTSNLYICPIIYGAGVKVKLLDAISYQMPIASTQISLDAISFISPKAIIDRQNNAQTAQNIHNLLNDKTALLEFQKSTYGNIESYYEARINELNRFLASV
ncbi:MAG: glycosyltransferase [Candidatus Gastranaerophilales bacterium]|nr:glycosyltransferase [Candidatus Gastranaerophilales bacterium]